MTEHVGDVRQAFDDIRIIDWELGQQERTVDAFLGLDKEAPDAAKSVYDIAQAALVDAKQFSLCGKYLEPDKAYERLEELHQWFLDFVDKNKEDSPETKRELREGDERNLVEGAATLIALLVLNDRMTEAEKVAVNVRSKSKYPNCNAVIDTALEGKIPSKMLAHEEQGKKN